MNFRIICYGLLLALSAVSCKRTGLDRSLAKQGLQSALAGKIEANNVDGKRRLITNPKAAVQIAEAVLFDLFGKKEIKSQRPYDVYDFQTHWVISGTLPASYEGGTFLLILDARNGEIIEITHGK